MDKEGRGSEGFSVVEAVITLLVASIFLLAFYAMFISVSASTTLARQQTNAQQYAYFYVRYASGAIAGYRGLMVCDSTTDLTANPNAAGHLFQTDTGGNPSFPLPPPVSISMYGYYPAGCSATAPIKIKAVVTWGPKNFQAAQAAYAD